MKIRQRIFAFEIKWNWSLTQIGKTHILYIFSYACNAEENMKNLKLANFSFYDFMNSLIFYEKFVH